MHYAYHTLTLIPCLLLSLPYACLCLCLRRYLGKRLKTHRGGEGQRLEQDRETETKDRDKQDGDKKKDQDQGNNRQ
jgi:hypothetical protein